MSLTARMLSEEGKFQNDIYRLPFVYTFRLWKTILYYLLDEYPHCSCNIKIFKIMRPLRRDGIAETLGRVHMGYPLCLQCLNS